MREIMFFDGAERQSLLPLTYLRPVAECRIGMFTIREKWCKRLSADTFGYLTEDYLAALFPSIAHSADTIYINGAVLPTNDLAQAVGQLKVGEALMSGDKIVACRAHQEISGMSDLSGMISSLSSTQVEATFLTYPEHIVEWTRTEFLSDHQLCDTDQSLSDLDPSVRVRGNDLYLGKNVEMYDAIINTTDGPVYIDDDAVVMEAVVIKGPVYIGKGTRINVGAKVYQDTMLGPQCRLGGEIKRSTMFGYSNKGHDGFLGDSVLTSWCNLGADTNNSNLKNTYGYVSLYDISQQGYRTTEMQFLGMVLGDHTMSAINTSFNTGTVTGIFTNVIDRAPARYMPSFSWGKDQVYDVEKAIQVARIVQKRRNIDLSEAYADALRHLAAQRS